MRLETPTLASPLERREGEELDKTRLERMTSTDGEPGHALPDVAAAEVEFSNDNWDPGSYLDAVREDLASAFAPAPSPPPAVERTNPIAKPLRIQETPGSTPGRTPIHGRPIILRNLHKHASSLLTQEETSHLLRSLTQRDVAILQALHDYRYLIGLEHRLSIG